MKYILSEKSGFCFGVKHAVDTVNKLLDDGNSLCCYGSLIHNKKAIEKLSEKGLCTENDLDNIDCEKYKNIVIRAHGAAPFVYEKLKQKGVYITDLTCPYVKKIQNIVHENSKKGRQTIIFGDENHPEIIGIKGYAGENVIVLKDLQELKNSSPQIKDEALAVFQTTFNLNLFEETAAYLKENFSSVRIIDTVCRETQNRQNAVMETAKKVDFMIIIGDKTSSNSKKLYEISKKICPSVFIEEVFELKKIPLNEYETVGVAAGASTPGFIIDSALAYLKSI